MYGKSIHKRNAAPGEQLLCKKWVTVWNDGRVQIAERKPTVVKEYDFDEEFRHLGYAAFVISNRRQYPRHIGQIWPGLFPNQLPT